jgi:hypothetical protein
LSTAKYYRKWINEVGENCNAQEVTKEYINEIKGTGKFIEKPGGKLVKTLCSFGVNTAVGAAVAGPAGAVTGLALSLLESLWVDSLIKGKNPSMFIEDVRHEIKERE